MNRLHGCAHVLALLLIVGGGGYALDAKPKEEKAGWERYQLLIQKNIFDKERGDKERERKEKGETKNAPPPPKEQADVVLVGVVLQDGKPLGILENRKSGKIARVKPGDKYLEGEVTEISIDKLTYTLKGESLVVTLGKNLEGNEPKALAADGKPAETPSTETKPADGGAKTASTETKPATPGSTESIVEKLRRKRQEELNK